MPAKVRKDKGILSFAVELLQNIGDQIDRLEDKKSLRATCSRLNGALRPQVLSSLTLRIHKHNLESGIALLEALLNDGGFSAVDRWPLISECVRTLYIESLSPSFYPDPDFGTRALPNLDQLDSTRRDWVRDVTDGLKVKEAHKKLESLLGPALRSLSNIRSIHWECDCQRDPNWTAHVTMNSLSHLNFLRRLTITYIPDESDISVLTAIPNFHNLKSFSFITPDSVSHPSRVMNQIVAHLANQFLPENRSLTSFHIDSGIQGYPLHPWLNENLQTIGQLEGLQHLGLKGWNLSSPEEEIRSRFQSLTSLTLTSCRSTSDIWSMLRRDGVHLHHIEIDVVDDHLLSYLSSYSGLVRLSLKDIPLFANVNNGDTNTDKFYEHVLPRHAYSLEHLEILPIFEGRWCFELPAWRALSHCRALRSLAFKVKSQGLPPGTPADRNLMFGDRNNDKNTVVNPVNLLLTTAFESLPFLRALHIDSARSPVLDPPHLNDRIDRISRYRLGVRRRIKRAIEVFHVPKPLSTRFRELEVFVGGQRCEIGSGIGFIKSWKRRVQGLA